MRHHTAMNSNIYKNCAENNVNAYNNGRDGREDSDYKYGTYSGYNGSVTNAHVVQVSSYQPDKEAMKGGGYTKRV